MNKLNSPIIPFHKGDENKKAFTLVELIVVITILAILATIGFVSFSGYLAGTRDTNRIAQLKSMSDALELYRTKKDLPIPDDKVDVKANSKTIAYQGYIGKNVLETIEYTESGLDPKDKTYFSYYLTKNKKYFQLLAFLEEENKDVVAMNTGHPQGEPLQNNLRLPFMGPLNATDYSDRIPKTTGKKLGILTDKNNTPIQEVTAITSSGFINLNNVGKEEYKAIISDQEIIIGSGTALANTNPKASCKRIKQLKGSSNDGTYTIDPEANGTGFKVYCDMTTDGGGWTKVMDEDGEIKDRITYFITPVTESTKYPGYYQKWKSKILPLHNDIYIPNYCKYPGDWRKKIIWKDTKGNDVIFISYGGDLLSDIKKTYYSHFDQNSDLFEVKCPGNGNNTRRNGSNWVTEGNGGICVNSYVKGIIRNRTLANNSEITVNQNRDAIKCEIWVR